MSIRLMSNVWDIRWPTQNHLLVMLKLADHANNEGAKVWPAVGTIAAQAQCSERTVQNVMKALRDCGLVTVLKPGGGSTPTIYELNVKLLETLALCGAKLMGSADAINIPEEFYAQAGQTGAMVAPLGIAQVQPGTGTGATDGGTGAKLLHPNHHLEPSSKPYALAREDSKSDLKSEARAATSCFVITRTDACWSAWIDLIRKKTTDETAERANAAGEMTVVGSRWPRDDSPVPRIPRPKTVSTARMTGEGNAA